MLKARAIPPSESQALEVATALLFVESALDNYFRLGGDMERQARTVSDRLKAAMAGEAVPPMDTIEGGILDEMTRRAHMDEFKRVARSLSEVPVLASGGVRA